MEVFQRILNSYTDEHFILPDGSMNLKTIVVRVSELLYQFGFQKKDCGQNILGLTIYPSEFFCPSDFNTGKLNITPNTYTIHHFAGSWLPEEERIIMDYFRRMQQKYPRFIAVFLAIVYGFFVRITKAGIKKSFIHYKKQITGK